MHQLQLGVGRGSSWAIVRAKDDQRIVRQLQPVQGIKHFTDSVVRMRQDRRINIVGLLKFLETPTIFRNCVERSMGLVDPKVNEKRLLITMARLDELNRISSVFVNRHLFARTIERAVLIVAIRGGHGRIRDHVVGQVPLAKMRRAIAGSPEELGDGRSFGAQPIGHVAFRVAGNPGKVPINVVSGRKMARHDCRTTGRANSAGD